MGENSLGWRGTNPSFNVLSIVGTRPEAIKMAPLVQRLERSASIRQRLLLTGQHPGLASAFKGQRLSLLDLPLGRLGFEAQRDAMRDAIGAHLRHLEPDLVIVQGDTTSALAGALAAHDIGIPIAHVEAGLRSHNREPWPEEENRVCIDSLSSLLFAPTDTAAANLAADEAVWGVVHVTGNTGVDALMGCAGTPPGMPPQGPRKRILVTCHRRENQKDRFALLCQGFRRLVRELPVELTYLMHPNPHLMAAAKRELGGVEHIALRPAASHEEMVKLIRGSWALLTDSGGLQEDGAALGIPVLVLREVTERVEAPDNICLVGRDPASIVTEINRLLMDQTAYARMARPSLAFGDGQAAVRITAHIESWLRAHAMKPPGPALVSAPSIEWDPL